MTSIPPLTGIRVLDLTNVLAGPFCCHQLAHLGAEVIKVEAPGRGDLARQLGADPELNSKLMGVSFLAQNAGKKSITLNLKHPAGKEILKRLVQDADVLVENFRPGVMDRLELGYRVLKTVNPALVYCAISGFGQDGPMSRRPAYDQIIQGLAGVMQVTGEPEGNMYRVGFPIADTIGGLTAAFAIAGMITGRAANGGRGGLIDISMLESVIATMGWVVSNYLVADKTPGRNGNDNMTAAPSGMFRTGDGYLNIAANKQEQFEALCAVTGLDRLAHNPLFATRQARLDNRKALTALLEEALAGNTTAYWVEALNKAGVPAGEVLSVAEALALPQIAGRGMIAEFDGAPGVDRVLRLLRTGIKIDGNAPKVDSPPPALGGDTAEILGQAGFSAEEITRFQKEGAL